MHQNELCAHIVAKIFDLVVILFALPLDVVGVFVALALSGREFDRSALIGMPMLIDLVVTNAIVLLDLVQRPCHRAA